MTLQIKYAQSYMQPNGQMTIDALIQSTESIDIVIGVDPLSSDATPKSLGPRFVNCIPANTCSTYRYTNVNFNDPFYLYLRRCISGPNCAGNSCLSFSLNVDSTFTATMVDYSGTGIPSSIFGSPYPIPSKYISGCPTGAPTPPAPSPPPAPITYKGYTIQQNTQGFWMVKSPNGISLGGYDTLDAAKARVDQAVGAITVLNVSAITAELSSDTNFPGTDGWIRMNVTATGSGMVAILVDGVRLLEDGPLNPGTTPITYTYLRQLNSGTRKICANGESETGTVGNQVCTQITVPTPPAPTPVPTPPPTPAPTNATHMIQMQLSSNQYISMVEQNILKISDELVSHLPTDPNIKYVKTDYDSSSGFVNIYLQWTGPTATMNYTNYTMGDQSIVESYIDYDRYSIYGLITPSDIIESIKNFARLYLIPGIIIAIGIVVGGFILSAGLTVTAVAGALLVISSFFVVGYFVYDLEKQVTTAQDIITNQQAFIQTTTQKDAAYKTLDDAYKQCIATRVDKNDCCLTLLKGYQQVDLTYINQNKEKLPNMDLKAATDAYNTCSNTLIDTFKSTSQTCDQVRANWGPCRDNLYANAGDQFNKNYTPGTEYKKPEKPTDYTKLAMIAGISLFGLAILGRSGGGKIVIEK